jgi:hypothetical protein
VLGRLDGGTFDSDFLSSGAFQIGRADKDAELRSIAKHYDTPTACLILFDDGAPARRPSACAPAFSTGFARDRRPLARGARRARQLCCAAGDAAGAAHTASASRRAG